MVLQATSAAWVRIFWSSVEAKQIAQYLQMPPCQKYTEWKAVYHKVTSMPNIYHPHSNKQLMSSIKPCQKLLKLRLYYIIITEKQGANKTEDVFQSILARN